MLLPALRCPALHFRSEQSNSFDSATFEHERSCNYLIKRYTDMNCLARNRNWGIWCVWVWVWVCVCDHRLVRHAISKPGAGIESCGKVENAMAL
jgi:hypothetical protein